MTVEPESPPGEQAGTLIVPLRSRGRERAVLLQKAQHVAPAVVLLLAGVTAFREKPEGLGLVLAVFEIVSSLLMLGSIAVAIRKLRRPVDHAHAPHAHHGVDWIDIFTAGVLFVEAAEHWHQTHHIARPKLFLAFVLLIIGLLHGRIARRAAKRFTIRVGEEDLHIGGKPFRSIRGKWSDVRSIDIGPRYATVTMRQGRVRKLDLADLEGANHVRTALVEAQRRVAMSHSVPLPSP